MMVIILASLWGTQSAGLTKLALKQLKTPTDAFLPTDLLKMTRDFTFDRIETLFEILPDEATRNNVLGFSNYEDLVLATGGWHGQIVHLKTVGWGERNVVFDEQNKFVTELWWSDKNIRSVNWNALSKLTSLTRLYLNNNQLEGPVDWKSLPRGLEVLYLYSNQLSGGIDTASLPDRLTDFQARDNQFGGIVDLSRLPRGMVHFMVQNNNLFEYGNFDELPAGLRVLNLENNAFQGTIQVNHLPPNMQYLILRDNKFVGNIDLNHLPPTMVEIWLQGNQLDDIDLRNVGENTFIYV